MLVLGLSAHAADAAAVLVRDGRPIAAAREELFTGVRAESSFPRRAVRFCFLKAAVTVDDLDAVVFFAKPLRKFEREMATMLQGFPSTSGPFSSGMFRWLGDRLWMRNGIVAELGVDPDKILFSEHHQAHAASAFLTSPFDEAAILTTGMDGEWATTALSAGSGSTVEVKREIHHPHGLPRLVGAVSRFLALDPAEDENKLMALAGYGTPRFLEPLRRLVTVGEDGSFELASQIAGHDSVKRDLEALGELFGAPRPPDEPLRFAGDDTRDADVASSLREVLVEVHLALLRSLAGLVPSKNLCLGGTLARDPALNARLLEGGPFERLWADPAAGNAAAACGAALLAAAGDLERRDRAGGALGWLRTGPEAADEPGEKARELEGEEAVLDALIERLTAGKLVGWMRGPAEFSGRSLGGRALLADPRSAQAAERIRGQVKRREPFVPFGALVPAERAADLFQIGERALEAAVGGGLVAQARDEARSKLAGVVHADGSVRLRAVTRDDDPLLHALLERFGQAAGVPVLLHTTLRLFGEPLAKSEADGLRVLERSQLDSLVVERRLYDAG